jgi:hypothetical protein
MAERKSGPVKPPVIDLKARPAEPASASETPGEKASAPGPKAIEATKITAPLAPPETPAKPAAAEVIVTAPPPDKPEPAAAADPRASKPTGDVPPPGTPKQSEAPKAAAARPEKTDSPAGGGSGAAKPPGGAPAAGQGGTAAPERQSTGRFWPAALIGAAAGAVIGIAVCYGLAAAGYWPGNGQGDLAQRLDQVRQASGANDAKLTALGQRLDALQNDLPPRLQAAESNLATLQAGLKPLQAAPADLTRLGTELKSLSTRLDAVAAGASSADAGALAASLKTAQQNLATLTQKVDALATRASTADTTVAALKAELDHARAAIDKAAAAPSPQAIAAAMQLPILISALDADFAAGRPYASDLTALKAALPQADIPASVTASAAKGLPAAADVAAGFEAQMPDMIAAEPGSPAGGWQDQLAGWARNLLALRKVGAESGSGPDALLSQLETAVARHDFVGAAALLDKLPAPMQRAAGRTAGDIRTLADAETFISGLRQKALAPVAGASS